MAAIAFLMARSAGADACTGLYVGKQCSAGGTTIIARCNDFHPAVIMPYVQIYPSVTGVAGRMVNGINGFSWELPSDTYHYVAVPYPDISDYGIFASAATNEFGLAMTATITGYYCQAAREADGDVSDGIAEETIPSILAASCKTAREAIELLARIVDEKGSAEQNIVMIADQQEAWYMEMYSGHQYCAVKMPEDKVAVFGNEFMLDTVDPQSHDVICSKNLFKLPRKHGFDVYDEDGRMNLRRTYQGDGRMYDFCHLRTWGGRRLLAPSATDDYQTQTYYPLFFSPDSKVGLEQVMAVFRDRYEGTPYNPETSGNDECRVIGDESQEEVHIIEVHDNLPAPMACVTWLTLSEAAHAPFVPIPSAITDCSPAYKLCAQEWGYNKQQAQHIYKRVNSFCANNREIYSAGVKDYWRIVESHVLEEFPSVLEYAATQWAQNSEAAASTLTSYSTSLQESCLQDAERLFDDLTWHMMSYTQTNPYGCNFTTLQNRPSPMPKFQARMDLGRVAQWKGWEVSGSGDGALILVKDGRKIVVTPSGKHRTSKGSVTVSNPDGTVQSTPVYATWESGSLLVPLSLISLL